MTQKQRTKPVDVAALHASVIAALEDIKAQDIVSLDVRGKTALTDFMIIASGTSDRQVKALSDNVLEEARKLGVRPLGVEGDREAEWILIDLNDVVVHIMLPKVRVFYALEKLWGDSSAGAASDSGES